MYTRCLFFSVLTLLFFTSCLEKNDSISFREEDLKAIEIEDRWAVVSEPYVSCREKPAYDARIVRNLRRGTLEKVEGEKTVTTDGKAEKWIAFSDGWVPSASVRVYSNRLRAEKSLQSD